MPIPCRMFIFTGFILIPGLALGPPPIIPGPIPPRGRPAGGGMFMFMVGFIPALIFIPGG